MIVTAESLEEEQLELRVKVRQLRTHDACPSLHPKVHVRVSADGKDHSDARVRGFGPNDMTPREGCTVKVCEIRDAAKGAWGNRPIPYPFPYWRVRASTLALLRAVLGPRGGFPTQTPGL